MSMANKAYPAMAPLAFSDASFDQHDHSRYLWGVLIISISILFMIVTFCCFFKRKVLPEIRHRIRINKGYYILIICWGIKLE